MLYVLFTPVLCYDILYDSCVMVYSHTTLRDTSASVFNRSTFLRHSSIRRHSSIASGERCTHSSNPSIISSIQRRTVSQVSYAWRTNEGIRVIFVNRPRHSWSTVSGQPESHPVCTIGCIIEEGGDDKGGDEKWGGGCSGCRKRHGNHRTRVSQSCHQSLSNTCSTCI